MIFDITQFTQGLTKETPLAELLTGAITKDAYLALPPTGMITPELFQEFLVMLHGEVMGIQDSVVLLLLLERMETTNETAALLRTVVSVIQHVSFREALIPYALCFSTRLFGKQPYWVNVHRAAWAQLLVRQSSSATVFI